MRQLTAFDVPVLKAILVPVELHGLTNSERRHNQAVGWNKTVRRWHRTGGRP
jgi:hypothetical protein